MGLGCGQGPFHWKGRPRAKESGSSAEHRGLSRGRDLASRYPLLGSGSLETQAGGYSPSLFLAVHSLAPVVCLLSHVRPSCALLGGSSPGGESPRRLPQPGLMAALRRAPCPVAPSETE